MYLCSHPRTLMVRAFSFLHIILKYGICYVLEHRSFSLAFVKLNERETNYVECISVSNAYLYSYFIINPVPVSGEMMISSHFMNMLQFVKKKKKKVQDMFYLIV